MVKHPTKFSSFVIYPIDKKIKISQTHNELLDKQFMIDSMNKTVREKRYYDIIQNLAKANRKNPLPLRNKSYDDIFKKLIEGCRGYFTREYGKNEDDYRRFVNGCTKTYETPGENENSNSDRIKYFLKEIELEKEQDPSVITVTKKSRHAFFPRKLTKLARNLSDSSRFRLNKLPRRSKVFGRRARASKKSLVSADLEQSGSDITEASNLSANQKLFARQYKPFIFKLSDPEMIKNGITVNYQLPLRIITFSAIPSNPLTFWFKPRKKLLLTHHPNGRICSRFEKDGTGTIYYENGETAISFAIGRIGPLIMVHSKSTRIGTHLQKSLPVALFDLRSNGVVYDGCGSKRLIYDQAEGILFDRPSKIPLRWKWNSYDQVICRREELQFVPQTNLVDFDYLKKAAGLERKLYNRMTQRRLKAKKRYSDSSKETMKRRKKHPSSLISSTRSSIHRRAGIVKRISTIKKPLSSTSQVLKQSIIDNLNMPKLLKFVGKGFIIKPLFPPCPKNKKKGTVHTKSKESDQSDIFKAEKSGRPNLGSFVRRKPAGYGKQKKIIIQPVLKLLPLTECKYKRTLSPALKPIVLKLTENVSLTIMEQAHIHIDYSCHPMHYMFCIGVQIMTENLKTIFDIRGIDAEKELLPSIFEVLKKKCPILYNVNRSITNLRIKAERKCLSERIKKLKTWGQYKHHGKIPICKLMDYKCRCVKCQCSP